MEKREFAESDAVPSRGSVKSYGIIAVACSCSVD